MNDLKDLYVDQLQDLHSACKQSRDVTVELEKAAHDEELKKALHAGHKGISDGIAMLEDLIKAHDADIDGEHCKGMEGLVREARAHGIEADISDPATRDAAIITQYQRMAHYAIAAWGCVKAFATRLGLDDDAKLIDTHLGNTYDGDETMTAIAMQKVNKAAA